MNEDRFARNFMLFIFGFPMLFAYFLGVNKSLSAQQTAYLFDPASGRVFELVLQPPRLHNPDYRKAVWIPFRDHEYYSDVASAEYLGTLIELAEEWRRFEKLSWEEREAQIEDELRSIFETIGSDDWKTTTDVSLSWRWDVELETVIPKEQSYLLAEAGVHVVDVVVITSDQESRISTEVLHEVLLVRRPATYRFRQEEEGLH